MRECAGNAISNLFGNPHKLLCLVNRFLQRVISLSVRIGVGDLSNCDQDYLSERRPRDGPVAHWVSEGARAYPPVDSGGPVGYKQCLDNLKPSPKEHSSQRVSALGRPRLQGRSL